MRTGMTTGAFFLLLALVAFVAGRANDSPTLSGAAFALGVIGFASVGATAAKDKKNRAD